MDLFAKDHPLEAAAMRMRSAKPLLRSFKFEELPPTARHRIYRELLLKPKEADDHSAAEEDDESYASEHEKLDERIADLMIEFDGSYAMHTEIMRTNKKIHEEAAAILYGENWFTESFFGIDYQPLWMGPYREKALCPRHYSRLITKLCLVVTTRGDDWTTMNVSHASKTLTLNNLKILKVDFYNGIGFGKGYYGQRCLEPLKKCRAEKFLINTYPSRAYAAELKAAIEGPRDAKFQAYRKATEDEPESDYNEPELAGFDDHDEDNPHIVEGESEDKDEGGTSVMEGIGWMSRYREGKPGGI